MQEVDLEPNTKKGGPNLKLFSQRTIFIKKIKVRVVAQLIHLAVIAVNANYYHLQYGYFPYLLQWPSIVG